MKKYVIICDKMYWADSLWRRTIAGLGDLISHVNKYPILNIELCDGRSLYFVSEDYWFRRGGNRGRHDWKPISYSNFEAALGYYVGHKELFVEYDI